MHRDRRSEHADLKPLPAHTSGATRYQSCDDPELVGKDKPPANVHEPQAGLDSDAELKALRRENSELRRVKAILKTASAFSRRVDRSAPCSASTESRSPRPPTMQPRNAARSPLPPSTRRTPRTMCTASISPIDGSTGSETVACEETRRPRYRPQSSWPVVARSELSADAGGHDHRT